jgi:hypothetical protein
MFDAPARVETDDEAAEEEAANPDPAFEALAVGETVLDNPNEFYFRQCHPSFASNGVPSTQMFGDFPRDGGKLSGNRGETVTPKAAFNFHTATLGKESGGTWAVTAAEVATVLSRVVDDTVAPSVRPPDPVPPGHSYIDMRHLTSRERKRLRAKLLIAAVNRGRVYPDETGVLDVPSDE